MFWTPASQKLHHFRPFLGGGLNNMFKNEDVFGSLPTSLKLGCVEVVEPSFPAAFGRQEDFPIGLQEYHPWHLIPSHSLYPLSHSSYLIAAKTRSSLSLFQEIFSETFNIAKKWNYRKCGCLWKKKGEREGKSIWCWMVALLHPLISFYSSNACKTQ